MFGSNTFGNLGARKGGKKRRRKARKARSSSCRTGIVRFKTKRGKVVSFKGKIGSGCAPRKKPSTRHLARYKSALAKASRACKGRHGKSFRSCVASKM